MKELKEKIKDWWDDIIWNYRHSISSIRRYFEGIGRCISYRKVLKSVYDFDYSSILSVEKFQMMRVRDSIIKYQSHMNWERDVRHINLALKLLDIIEEDGCSERIGKPITFEPIEGTSNSRLVDDPDEYWALPIYVNTKNYKRFWESFNPIKFQDKKLGNLFRDNLRVEKAWYLYNELRTYFLRQWWD